MILPIALVQTPAGPASRIATHMDGAVIKSATSPNNRPLSTWFGPGGPPDDQLETQLLIDMRYQQHLALQGLQELFESGEWGSF